MAIYRLGSRGEEVREIQRRLAAAGLYSGNVDGVYGGGTQAGVTVFQRAHALQADGRAGPATWQALCQTEAPVPAIANRDLAYKCLALTGSFETGRAVPECFCGISGDFDGQGISFGVLQWNFGQGSLQPLLKAAVERHPQLMGDIFGPHFETLRLAMQGDDRDSLLEFSRAIQHPVTHSVFEPWKGYAKALGRTAEFQQIQTEHAGGVFRKALTLLERYGLWSERAVALLFDIVTQNGSIASVTHAQIVGEIRCLPSDLDEATLEIRRLEIIANRRAEAANPRWVDDVRQRKLCIARGEGTVHGIAYHLDDQFSIGMRRFQS